MQTGAPPPSGSDPSEMGQWMYRKVLGFPLYLFGQIPEDRRARVAGKWNGGPGSAVHDLAPAQMALPDAFLLAFSAITAELQRQKPSEGRQKPATGGDELWQAHLPDYLGTDDETVRTEFIRALNTHTVGMAPDRLKTALWLQFGCTPEELDRVVQPAG